jgi:hypothetical protein
MNIILETFQIVEYIAAGIILVFGVFFAINKMSYNTPHDIRLAWVCLSAGSMAVFLWHELSHPLLIVGVALFVIADKRRVLTHKESTVEYL